MATPLSIVQAQTAPTPLYAVCGEPGCTEPLTLEWRSYGRTSTWLLTCPREDQHQAEFVRQLRAAA